MLQGDNRFDRMLKYMKYLKWHYRNGDVVNSEGDVHPLHVVPGVGHNAQQMILTDTIRCVVFRVCDVPLS